MTRKAVSMFSGGLDSILAALVVKEQGIEVTGFHLASVFCKTAFDGDAHPEVKEAADEIGIELHVESSSEAMLKMVKNPKHGLGKNMNPCIDCRINTILQADRYRREIEADFIVSGEVMGQRPMSQNRRAMEMISKKVGIADILLRPLCANLLEPTLPEREGWINRDILPQARGRSRSVQLELAKKYGIKKYGSPAGGCYLTEEPFSNKLRDLLAVNESPDIDEIKLLKVGRHFRLSDKVRVTVGRFHEENEFLEQLQKRGDILLQCFDTRGAIALVRDYSGEGVCAADLNIAAGLAVHYSRSRDKTCADVEKRSFGEPYDNGAILKNVSAVNPETLENIADIS